MPDIPSSSTGSESRRRRPIHVQETEKEVVVKGSIDDRLKQIQDEDNSFTGAIESGFSYELDEKVVIPNKKDKKSEKNLITINKIFYTKNRVTLLSITRKILVSAP